MAVNGCGFVLVLLRINNLNNTIMDTYNLNDDVAKMMEEYFDIEFNDKTKRFSSEDMHGFTIHVVIELNKPAVSKCESIEREAEVCECKHQYKHIELIPVVICTDCDELLGKQTDC